MRIKDGFMMREVSGKYVVVPVGDGTRVFKGMIQMNGLGAFLWNQLKQDQTRESLIEAVLEHYEGERDPIIKDVDMFITRLLDAGVMEK